MSLKESNIISNLRPYLVTHLVEQQEAFEDGKDISSNHSYKLSRYLIAARKERGWSRSFCAQKAAIAEADLYYLERGLILSTSIKPALLHSLAQVFEEDIHLFECLLDRKIPLHPPTSFDEVTAQLTWAHAFFYTGKRLFAVLVLMCVALASWAVTLVFNPFFSNSFQFKQVELSFAPVVLTSGGGDLNFFLVSTAVTLLMIVAWVFVYKGDAIFVYFQQQSPQLKRIAVVSAYVRRFIRTLSRWQVQRKLVYVTIVVSLLMPLGIVAAFDEPTPEDVQQTQDFYIEIETMVERPYSAISQDSSKRTLLKTALIGPIFKQQIPILPTFFSNRIQLEITISKSRGLENSALLLLNNTPMPTSETITSSFMALHKPNTLQMVAFLDQWHNKYTGFAFIQLLLTSLLYTLMSIIIMQKGKRMSAFGKLK